MYSSGSSFFYWVLYLTVLWSFLCTMMFVMDTEVRPSDLSWRNTVYEQPSVLSFFRICLGCRKPLHPPIGMPFPRWPTFNDWSQHDIEAKPLWSTTGPLWLVICAIYRPGFSEPVLWFNFSLCFLLPLSTQFLSNKHLSCQTPFQYLLPGNPTCANWSWE